MSQTSLLLLGIVATLRSSSYCLFNSCVAPDSYGDYSDTELVEVEDVYHIVNKN